MLDSEDEEEGSKDMLGNNIAATFSVFTGKKCRLEMVL